MKTNLKIETAVAEKIYFDEKEGTWKNEIDEEVEAPVVKKTKTTKPVVKTGHMAIIAENVSGAGLKSALKIKSIKKPEAKEKAVAAPKVIVEDKVIPQTSKKAKQLMKVEDAPVVAPKVIVEDKVDPAKVAKPKAEKKVIAEKVPVFTRMEAIGQTLKKFEALYTPEEMIAAADTLYTERTGKPSNLKESKCLYGFAVNFLAGYNK